METHRKIRHYKSRTKVADSFGKGEDGAVDMPVKASGTKISRMLKSKKACPFCFPHGPETPNATAKKNKKSWKNRRKEQYKERLMIERYMGIKNLDIIERNNFIKKTKDVFNKSILKNNLRFFSIISSITLYSSFLAFTVDPTGFVHKSHNDVSPDSSLVTLIRKPLTGHYDTVKITIAPACDQWSTLGSNFDPELTDQDTLNIYVSKEYDGRTYSTKTFLTGGSRNPLETCLGDPNKSVKTFTPNIFFIKDTSNISEILNGILYLNKNINQKIDALVDTQENPLHIVDFYANLERQDSTFTQGDSFTIRLEKRLVNQPVSGKDIVYSTEVKSAIDTTFWDAMKVNADNSIHNGAFHGDTLYFPMSVETITSSLLQQVSFTEPIIKGDTIILNYKCDNALGYKILRKDNNQGDFKLINSTEKSQYKDVVPNGIYDYLIQAIGNNGKVLNEQSFKIKKANYRKGIENKVKKVLYLPGNDKSKLFRDLDRKEIYGIDGRKKNLNDITTGIYFVK